METHSSILAWEIPWTEEPGGLQSMASEKKDFHHKKGNCDWRETTNAISRRGDRLEDIIILSSVA